MLFHTHYFSIIIYMTESWQKYKHTSIMTNKTCIVVPPDKNYLYTCRFLSFFLLFFFFTHLLLSLWPLVHKRLSWARRCTGMLHCCRFHSPVYWGERGSWCYPEVDLGWPCNQRLWSCLWASQDLFWSQLLLWCQAAFQCWFCTRQPW